jgi:hypothetical protein
VLDEVLVRQVALEQFDGFVAGHRGLLSGISCRLP